MSSLKDTCDLYFGTHDIYKILGINKDASVEEVKKAYRKLSLVVHPDRVSEDQKEEATEKFKVLGKVHSILSDSEKRAIYDDTGCLDEFDTADLQEKDWYDYWRLLFKNVTMDDIDAYETKYKGSETELEDLKAAYEKGLGDMDEILNRVPFTSPDDEPRLREILQKLIDDGQLQEYEAFTKESPSKKRTRQKKYEQEAKRARKAAEELKKTTKNDTNGNSTDDLAKAIMSRKQEREAQAENFFKSLEEKYGGKSKKKSSRKAK